MLQAYNPSIVCAEKKLAGVRFEKKQGKRMEQADAFEFGFLRRFF